MTQAQFISQLKRSLGQISEAEKSDICNDYIEHFRMGLAEGKSEEAIAQALGNPRAIGHAYHITALLDEEPVGRVRPVSVLRAVFASLSLSLLNLIFVLGPFLGLVGVLIGLWAVAGALMLSGLFISVAPLIASSPHVLANPVLNAAFMFFSGVGVAALGLLAVLGMIKITQGFFLLTASYVRLNARIIRGDVPEGGRYETQ